MLLLRVSRDFFPNASLIAQCSNKQMLLGKNIYSVDLETPETSDICFSAFGSVYINDRDELPNYFAVSISEWESMKLILKPIIVTTDENLRAVSPQA